MQGVDSPCHQHEFGGVAWHLLRNILCVRAQVCVCVPFSSVTVAAARLPPRSLNQLFNIDASTRFPGATNTSQMSSEVEKREKQFIPRRWRSEFLAIAQFALFRIELGVSISRFDTHVCLSVNKCCHCLYSLSPVYQTGQVVRAGQGKRGPAPVCFGKKEKGLLSLCFLEVII